MELVSFQIILSASLPIIGKRFYKDTKVNIGYGVLFYAHITTWHSFGLYVLDESGTVSTIVDVNNCTSHLNLTYEGGSWYFNPELGQWTDGFVISRAWGAINL